MPIYLLNIFSCLFVFFFCLLIIEICCISNVSDTTRSLLLTWLRPAGWWIFCSLWYLTIMRIRTRSKSATNAQTPHNRLLMKTQRCWQRNWTACQSSSPGEGFCNFWIQEFLLGEFMLHCFFVFNLRNRNFFLFLFVVFGCQVLQAHSGGAESSICSWCRGWKWDERMQKVAGCHLTNYKL